MNREAELTAPIGVGPSQQLQLMDRSSRAWVRANPSPELWIERFASPKFASQPQ